MSKLISLVLAALIASGVAAGRLDENMPKISDDGQRRESLYLPDPQAAEFYSFGYRNALARYFWFRTVAYFGKHYKIDKDYRWFYHMCDLVTQLDPQATHVFEFGALMMAWEVGQPKAALELLDRGIEVHPDNWRLRYMRGMTYMVFLNNQAKATEDFVRASQLPDANPVVARLAARKLTESSDPTTGINYLRSMLEITREPTAQAALIERLRDAEFERDLRVLESARRIFNEKTNTELQEIGQLLEQGIVTSLPKDPFGGSYLYDFESKTFKSSTGKRRFGVETAKRREQHSQSQEGAQ